MSEDKIMDNTAGSGSQDPNGSTQEKKPEGKLFTQAEVNEIVQNRLARERKKETPDETGAIDYQAAYTDLKIDNFLSDKLVNSRAPLAMKYIKEEFKKQGFKLENGSFGDDAKEWLGQVFKKNPGLFDGDPLTGKKAPKIVAPTHNSGVDEAAKPSFKKILEQMKGTTN